MSHLPPLLCPFLFTWAWFAWTLLGSSTRPSPSAFASPDPRWAPSDLDLDNASRHIIAPQSDPFFSHVALTKHHAISSPLGQLYIPNRNMMLKLMLKLTCWGSKGHSQRPISYTPIRPTSRSPFHTFHNAPTLIPFMRCPHCSYHETFHALSTLLLP